MNLTPYNDRYCPLFEGEIDGELCYEIVLCMHGFFKLSSVPELSKIQISTKEARRICRNCEFADMN